MRHHLMNQQDQNQNTSILFECVIPGRVGIKKNGKKIAFRHGRPKIFSSDKYQLWENESYVHILRLKKDSKILPEMLLEAHFEFHFLNHSGEPDTSNCIEGPQDLLAKVGIIGNDKSIVSLRAIKKFGLEPKTIIKIYEFKQS